MSKTIIVNNKFELIQAVYSKEEIKKIDPAVPIALWGDIDTSIHVFNYNKNTVFGELENITMVAKERNINIKWKHEIEN